MFRVGYSGQMVFPLVVSKFAKSIPTISFTFAFERTQELWNVSYFMNYVWGSVEMLFLAVLLYMGISYTPSYTTHLLSHPKLLVNSKFTFQDFSYAIRVPWAAWNVILLISKIKDCQWGDNATLSWTLCSVPVLLPTEHLKHLSSILCIMSNSNVFKVC